MAFSCKKVKILSFSNESHHPIEILFCNPSKGKKYINSAFHDLETFHLKLIQRPAVLKECPYY